MAVANNAPSTIPKNLLRINVKTPHKIPKIIFPLFVIGELQGREATKKDARITPPERVSAAELYIASQFPVGKKKERRKTVDVNKTGICHEIYFLHIMKNPPIIISKADISP